MTLRPSSIASSEFLRSAGKPTWLESIARRAVIDRLSVIQHGCLMLFDGSDQFQFGNPNSDVRASVTVTDPRFFADVAFGGAVGGGEAFMRGYWQTDCLTNVVRIFARNRETLNQMDSGLGRFTRPLRKLFHRLNENSRKGSRRNISAHYDLGNDFFELWLDRRMQYSAAIFPSEDTDLDEAQRTKLDRLCQKLALRADDHLLEIGTGWGGLAIFAAEQFGCRVTTTTISEEQYEFARRRVADAGLQDRIELLLCDYRDLEGSYDKLVSVEMLEAVGHKFHSTYFRKCRDLLKPDGLMVLQTITIADQRYELAKRSVDFIQRYIFPGGCLPSLTSITDTLVEHTDLRITHAEDIGPHYAETLRHWHERLFGQVDDILDMGYSHEFLRMWKYYLCYCEGGFLERVIGNLQLVAIRPEHRQSVYLP